MAVKKQIIERTDTHLKLMDEQGVVKKLALATPGQISFINTMRVEAGKDPLKSTTIPAFVASKIIDKLKRERNQPRLNLSPNKPFNPWDRSVWDRK